MRPSMWSASTDLVFRRPNEADHARVLAVLEQWWGDVPPPVDHRLASLRRCSTGHARGGAEGARYRAALLPRLFFQHFATTSTVAESPAGLAGFLIGFVSPTEPGTGYVHFIGVDPAARRSGLGAALYRRFFDDAGRAGAHTVRAVTSPVNTASIAFHRAVGFTVSPVEPDYDGPGHDRVCFSRTLPC